MPDFPALLLKSRSARSSVLLVKAHSNTVIVLLSADLGPWLATPRGEGVRGWSCHPITTTPETSSAAVRQQAKLTS